MNKFVITYLEYIRGKNYPLSVLWDGDNVGDALKSFWESFFDEVDRKKVRDVKIYDLVERVCDTEYYPEEKK